MQWGGQWLNADVTSATLRAFVAHKHAVVASELRFTLVACSSSPNAAGDHQAAVMQADDCCGLCMPVQMGQKITLSCCHAIWHVSVFCAVNLTPHLGHVDAS